MLEESIVPEIPSVVPPVLDLGLPLSQQPVLEPSVKSTSLEDLLYSKYYNVKGSISIFFFQNKCFNSILGIVLLSKRNNLYSFQNGELKNLFFLFPNKILKRKKCFSFQNGKQKLVFRFKAKKLRMYWYLFLFFHSF